MTMRALLTGLVVVVWTAVPGSGRAADPRELVPMPPEIQESLLLNMQDHLVALDTILSHVAYQRFNEAARVADERLRFSNPEGEAAITQWFPPPMQAARDGLRIAATRFAKAAERADRDRDYASMREVIWAVSDITAACTACHGHFRVR